MAISAPQQMSVEGRVPGDFLVSEFWLIQLECQGGGIWIYLYLTTAPGDSSEETNLGSMI